MEHILISPGKLKLMLTKSELNKYELDDITMYGEDDYTRLAFRELLADVKENVGFDTAEDRVLIQLYPSRDGGAEVYITRIGIANKEEKKEGAGRIVVVYCFRRMDELFYVCERLKKEGTIRESSLWQGGDGYYLLTDEEYISREAHRARRERLSEYCHEYHSELMEAYVKEHCGCILPARAVERLAELR